MDNSELKALAEAAIEQSDNIGEAAWYTADCLQHLLSAGAPDAEFIAATNPAVVLGLIAKLDEANKRIMDLLSVAGVFSAVTERDTLKAENAQLKKQEIELKAEAEQLKAECEGLRAALTASRDFVMHEAEVRGFLDEHDKVSHRHPKRKELIDSIDAAMGKGELS